MLWFYLWSLIVRSPASFTQPGGGDFGGSPSGGGGGGYMAGGAVDSPAAGSGSQRNKDKQSILPVNVKQVLVYLVCWYDILVYIYT